MATFAFTNGNVLVGGTNLSDDAKAIEINVAGEELDDTAMGDTFHSRIAGLKDWSGTITFNQDFASSQVDATIFPLIGSVTTISAKADAGTASATNPRYNGNAIITGYTPITGEVGSLGSATLTFVGAGTLSRSTSD